MQKPSKPQPKKAAKAYDVEVALKDHSAPPETKPRVVIQANRVEKV